MQASNLKGPRVPKHRRKLKYSKEGLCNNPQEPLSIALKRMEMREVGRVKNFRSGNKGLVQTETSLNENS